MSDFKKFSDAVEAHINSMKNGSTCLYQVDVSKDQLRETFLEAFPEGTNPIYKERRQYDCNCCLSFIRTVGGMVSINENLEVVSIWDVAGLEYPFNVVASKLSELVKSAPIRDAYIYEQEKVGAKTTHSLGEDGATTIKWNHFACSLPGYAIVNKRVQSIEAKKASIRDPKNVFKRALDEISIDATNTVIELIEQDSLYRGPDYMGMLRAFSDLQKKYAEVPDEKKDNWCWVNSHGNHVSGIRNTAIGTLLVDISEGLELDVAVTKFEKIMAPENYKRPKEIATAAMIENAKKTVAELGFEQSLGRRHAVADDIRANNVLYINRDSVTREAPTGLDILKSEVANKPKNLSKVEAIGIEDFIKDVLPNATSIEALVEDVHTSNFMNLIAPLDSSAPSMLKWSNNFSWAYNGDVADSIIKKNVKNAGGNVVGVLRFSIQWNDDIPNMNDLDAHCIEPSGNHIYFPSKGKQHPSSGMLDVDIVNPGNVVAVENIIWTDINRMQEGEYTLYVNNFNHRGGRGFKAEIECMGKTLTFSHADDIRDSDNVLVAKINFSKKDGMTFLSGLEHGMSSKEVWGITSGEFTPVHMVMHSPNFWDGQLGIGNRHYFFMLDGCINPGQPRGFFNEYLSNDLAKHKRVFEMLGSRMRVEHSENQLAGLGFSSTIRNTLTVRVKGNFNRLLKINF